MGVDPSIFVPRAGVGRTIPAVPEGMHESKKAMASWKYIFVFGPAAMYPQGSKGMGIFRLDACTNDDMAVSVPEVLLQECLKSMGRDM